MTTKTNASLMTTSPMAVSYDCQSTSIRSQSAPCMYAKRYHTTASQQAYEVNPRHVRTPKEVPYDCQSTSIRSQSAPCTYAKRGTIRLPVNKHTKSMRAMYVRQKRYHTTASQQAYEVNPRHVRTPKEVPYDCQSTSIRSQSAPCTYAKRYHTTASQQAYEVNLRHVRTPKEVPYDCQSTSIRSQSAPCTYAKRYHTTASQQAYEVNPRHVRTPKQRVVTSHSHTLYISRSRFTLA